MLAPPKNGGASWRVQAWEQGTKHGSVCALVGVRDPAYRGGTGASTPIT